LSDILYRLFSRVLIFFVVPKFRSLVDNINNRHDAVDFAFFFKYLGMSIKPSQIKYEVTKLLGFIMELKPKVFMEIGTARGGTLFLFTRVADLEAICLSIDLPGGFLEGGYPKWNVSLYRSFARGWQKIHLIRADSPNPRTFEKLKKVLSGKKLDFLFIDGDHTYKGVKKDFEMYSPMVRREGIIAFHDIVPDCRTRYGIQTSSYTGDVPKFWDEIKCKYKYFEIVDDPNQDGCGIGVSTT